MVETWGVFPELRFAEDAEARRPLMEEDDSQPFTDEQWEELPPWRRDRIVWNG